MYYGVITHNYLRAAPILQPSHFHESFRNFFCQQVVLQSSDYVTIIMFKLSGKASLIKNVPSPGYKKRNP